MKKLVFLGTAFALTFVTGFAQDQSGAQKLVFKKGDKQTYVVRFSTGYNTERTKRMYESALEASLVAEVGEVSADGAASVTVKVEKMKAEFFDDNEQNENKPDVSWNSDDGKWSTRPGMMEDARWSKLAGLSLTMNVSSDGKVNSTKGLDDDEVQRLLKALLGEATFFNLKSAKGGSVKVRASDLETQLTKRWSERGPAAISVEYGPEGLVKDQKHEVGRLADVGSLEFSFTGKVSSEVKKGVFQSSKIDVEGKSKEASLYWRIEIQQQ
ncbi:MAG: hypothetical protein HYY16_12665 [Planctomycetes bacterium]|nr:hypothetical protein [Planctomycetota bacterium]